MAHFIFNTSAGEEAARRSLRAGTWAVDADERHRAALAAGDLVLVYLAAPARAFVGRAELAGPADANGVVLVDVEEWGVPIASETVLPRLGPLAKADFPAGVVEITAHEYETVLAVSE